MDSPDQRLPHGHRQQFKAVIALWMCLSLPWAVWPLLFPPGFTNSARSYFWNVHQQYPIHVVKPEWLKQDYYYNSDPYTKDWDWPRAETEARVAIVLIGAGVVSLWMNHR